MNKLLALPILILLGTSCVTQRRCLEKFPPTTNTTTEIIVRDSIVYKDTTIFITIPGDIQIDSVEIPCPPPPATYVPDTARAETEYAKALAYFKYPRIHLKLEQKESLLQVRLENALKEAYHWKMEYMKVTVTSQPVKYIPGIYKIALWLWVGVIIAVAGFLGLKFGTKLL